MEIFYDGQCPFCRRYVRLLELRSEIGDIALIDARSDDPRIEAVRQAGLSLDAGMAIRYGGRYWHGAEATWLLAKLTEARTPLQRLLRWLLRDRDRAGRIYPYLRAGRLAVLRLLGRNALA